MVQILTSAQCTRTSAVNLSSVSTLKAATDVTVATASRSTRPASRVSVRPRVYIDCCNTVRWRDGHTYKSL